AIPTLTRVASFVNPANSANVSTTLGPVVQRAADALGLELVPIQVRAGDDIAAAIATVATGRAGALVVAEEPLFTFNARQIAGLALQYRLPMMGTRFMRKLARCWDMERMSRIFFFARRRSWTRF